MKTKITFHEPGFEPFPVTQRQGEALLAAYAYLRQPAALVSGRTRREAEEIDRSTLRLDDEARTVVIHHLAHHARAALDVPAARLCLPLSVVGTGDETLVECGDGWTLGASLFASMNRHFVRWHAFDPEGGELTASNGETFHDAAMMLLLAASRSPIRSLIGAMPRF